MTTGKYTRLLTIAAIIIVPIAVYSVLKMPDTRSVTDKVGDAVHALPDGADKAERQLEDRTPGQKLGDAVKDTGDKIKDETAP